MPGHKAQEEYDQYWRTVINTMQDGLMVVDPDRTIISVNPAFEALTGYSAAELVGQPCALLECDSCDYQNDQTGQPGCGLFKEKAIKHCRCTLRRKDGTPLYVVKNAAVIKGRGGELMGGVETLTDLSEMVAKERELASLRRHIAMDQAFQGMVGRTQSMLNLFSLIESAAESDAPVLITGESGTGKEMVAEALHRLGRRAQGPFIKVNCAALNENILESELFGHVKGAFTGADTLRMGRFEAAKGGDFLLDEVGDLPPATQVKLLRVLQEKVIERVGDHRPIPVNVRIIAATHRDLKALVAQGRFREDLYYRVAVVPIHTPALREHRQDVPLLVEAFLNRILPRSGKTIQGVSRGAMELLLHHAWPGNVRELINALEYAVVLCPGGLIEPAHLPQTILGPDTPASNPPAAPAVAPTAPPATPPPALPRPSGEGERERIIAALAASGGRREAAAQALGISRVTLWKKMKDLGIQVEKLIY
ncbi:MAG: sigma 54-interacting transcriptional regulator [Deltaproteobacteria bacterium]|nr:sigma 54-interacting transcriptional regulator [Deltaproteobacteria bacterium]